jgi:P4 family phage/plasmid primase-like protien
MNTFLEPSTDIQQKSNRILKSANLIGADAFFDAIGTENQARAHAEMLDANPIGTGRTGYYSCLPSGKKIPNYEDLLLEFKREHPYKSICDMKVVYVFNGRFYEELTPMEIKGYSERKFQPKPKESMRQEFLNKVFANCIEKRVFFTDTTEGLICFQNGVLDLNDENEAKSQLLPHSPNFGFRSALPYDYNPLAECPTFDWWIKDVMLGDMDQVDVLQEFMGYVVRGGEYKYHKALWLSGSGRNGKSTFIDVLKAIIGPRAYSTLSLRQVINDKFSAEQLDGKIANFSEETGPDELSDSGPFKNLTGDGEIQAQKKYGDMYSFRNRAKMIMSYNEIPALKDLTEGMKSRPLIVKFDKDLTEESNQDKNIKKKLLAELPGIFNFALKGWERLEQNGQFTKTLKSTEAIQEIEENSCTVLDFITAGIEFHNPPENFLFKTVSFHNLYQAYIAYTGRYAYSKDRFSKRIAAHKDMKIRKDRSNKDRKYFGLSLKANYDLL